MLVLNVIGTCEQTNIDLCTHTDLCIAESGHQTNERNEGNDYPLIPHRKRNTETDIEWSLPWHRGFEGLQRPYKATLSIERGPLGYIKSSYN